MFNSKLVRLVAVGAMAGSAALALTPGIAGAAGSIKCSKMTGNVSTTVKLSGCTGNTGGASKGIAGSALAAGGTIKWVNGTKTIVKITPKQKGTACPTGSTEFVATGTVTKDTTGSATVGGAVKASVCVDGVGKVSLVPGTKVTI